MRLGLGTQLKHKPFITANDKYYKLIGVLP